MLQATIVLANTFWSTGALLPEKTHFVELLEITHPVMHAAHLTLALVLFGAANHCLHSISLRAAGTLVLFCLASSQNLCLALSPPDSLHTSLYCEELGEERGGATT